MFPVVFKLHTHTHTHTHTHNVKSDINAVVLRVVLYGCETWFLTLREGHRSRMCDNSVAMKFSDLILLCDLIV